MFSYEAPNPYKKNSFFSFLNLFSSSAIVGKLVLPAQSRQLYNLDETTLHHLSQNYHLIIREGSISTYDRALIATIELKPKSTVETSIDKQRFIIKFNGNGMLYQDAIEKFAQDADKLNMTVIGFNYRGVGNSEKAPCNFQDLITDGISQVQRLLDEGLDSKKITLDGLSLGGGVATMVAHYFHKKGQPVYLWNDRSFSSISKTAADMVAPEINNIFGDALETSLETSSSTILSSTGWNVNVAKAYKEIPEEYKRHIYVAKKSDHSYGDGVIDHRASLHEGVKADEKKKHIKTGYKMYSRFGFGHNMKREDLINADNISAQTLFEDIVRSHKY